MNKVKLSVIVPVYNAEKYLERCVESILNQTYEGEYEVILVDDGSTDSSGGICDELAEENNKIKVFHTVNVGASKARNFGMKRASGKYISFVDSDDYIEPNMYEIMLEQMESDKFIDVCVCLWNFINIDGENVVKEKNISYSAYGRRTGREVLEHIYESPYSNGVVVSPCNKLFKKDIICKSEFTGRYAEDDMLMSKLFSEKNCRIMVVKDRLYNYCENERQMTKQEDNINKVYFLDCLLERERLFSFSKALVFETRKLYEEMCIEYYMFFRKMVKMDRYVQKFKKYFGKLCLNNKIRMATKCRWMIFVISPQMYLKFVLKSK